MISGSSRWVTSQPELKQSDTGLLITHIDYSVSAHKPDVSVNSDTAYHKLFFYFSLPFPSVTPLRETISEDVSSFATNTQVDYITSPVNSAVTGHQHAVDFIQSSI